MRNSTGNPNVGQNVTEKMGENPISPWGSSVIWRLEEIDKSDSYEGGKNLIPREVPYNKCIQE